MNPSASPLKTKNPNLNPNRDALPSISIPDAKRGQTTHSDLLFRMKCDIGVDEIQLEPSSQSGGRMEESGWSRLILTDPHTGLFVPRPRPRPRPHPDQHPSKPARTFNYPITKEDQCRAQPDEREHQPRTPTMLKHYAARVVARAFKVAVLKRDDLRDWLRMVRGCGDLIKLEIWRAILDEGCMTSGVYLWKSWAIQDRKATGEFLEANDINESGGILRMGLNANPYGPTRGHLQKLLDNDSKLPPLYAFYIEAPRVGY